ncbi:hypothetical protein NCHU2750_37210 [Neorhizobium sp. NCHU2750]|nr:hypothetical protein NCHU2750_37210 [Neorhizobium sp. NCHU2750]
MPRDGGGEKIAIPQSARKGHLNKKRNTSQNGFTMTRMTMTIIRIVGTSFHILQ